MLPKLKKPLPLLSFPSPFAEVSLEAKTAFVYDLTDKKMLFGLHEEKTLPIASITKIMTALAAIRLLGEDAIVSVSTRALAAEGDNGLLRDEKWRVSELAKFMLLSSSNDAAEAFAEAAEEKIGSGALLQEMNNFARELGLEKTRFTTASGIDFENSAGGISNAREVSFLLYFAYVNYPDIFSITALPEADFISESGVSHKKIKNTNSHVTSLSFLASKTGLTKLAGGTLAVIVGGKRPIIVTALGSTQEGRFTDVSRLSAAAEKAQSLFIEMIAQ